MVDQNSQFYAILTNVGAAKQANADALGIPWKITQMAVGDANGTDPTPNASQTSLLNEWRRAPLNQLKVDDKDASIIVAEQVIPADIGGRWIREIGLYDTDGDLVAVANCAPTYKPLLSQGSGRTQIVRMNLVVSSSSNVQLKIDPSVVLATREFVTEELAKQDFKHSVLVATTGPIVLSGLQTIDAVVLPAGAAVLVKDQEAAKENGIYVVAAGTWTRRADADTSAKVTPGLLVHVEKGAINGDGVWQLVTDGPINLGVSALAFEMAFGRTGVAAGTYRSVTVDKYGRVVAATNPTTVAGYGLTDVYTKTQIDTALALKANLAGANFTGPVYVPNVPVGNNSQLAVNSAFVQATLAALVASSPAALDTLNELAAALGNDPNFATTVTNLLAGKADKATTLAGYGITNAQPLDSDLTALAALVTVGFYVNTGVGSVAARSITAGSGVSVSNGDGVAGNPVISLSNSGVGAGSYSKVTVDALGRVTAGSNPTTLAGAGITDAFTKTESNTAIQAAIAALVASSPAALDTLNELAAALGNDPNFASTMLNSLAAKADKAEFDTLATTLSGYFDGLMMANLVASPTTTINVTAGVARTSDNKFTISLPASMNAVLQSAGSWTSGSGGNKLDAGVRAASKWYHLFLIRKTSDGSADLLFSLSATAPTMPAGYSGSRRIGSVKTDASGNILPFICDLFTSGKRRFRWVTPVMDVDEASISSAVLAYVLSVPTGISVIAELNTYAYGGNMLVYLSPFGTNDLVPANTSGYAGFTCGYGAFNSDATDSAAMQFFIKTNESAQVRARSNSTGKISVLTIGWEE